MPGVESATIAYDHPLQSNWLDSFEIEGQVAPAGSRTPSANFIPVGSTYFETVRAEIVRGRSFTAQDDQDHPGAAIVNEAFVRHYFPNEDPLGRRLRPGPPARIWDGERFDVIRDRWRGARRKIRRTGGAVGTGVLPARVASSARRHDGPGPHDERSACSDLLVAASGLGD